MTLERRLADPAQVLAHDGMRPAAPPPVDQPARSDEFVRGLSEAIGGPLGTHATRSSGGARYYTVARIVLALVCLTLAAHWVQKSPCQDGAWSDLKQYREMCYTDVLALYYNEGLSDGKIPWPVGRRGPNKAVVVYKGLAQAVRKESAIAVAHW